ncbi:MAG: hypothetical protein ACI89D_002470 [Bermanella sp.]
MEIALMSRSTPKYILLLGLSGLALLSGCHGSDSSGSSNPPPTVTETTPELPPVTTEFGCGAEDTPEAGIQGDIPRADQDSGRAALGYNCGLSPIHQLEMSGAVQGYDHCIYVRTASDKIEVFDMSSPITPVQLASLTPAGSSGSGGTSETLRVVVTENNSSPPLLASGSSIYDISDCENPVDKGAVAWPGSVPWPAGLSHDIRIGHAGDKVYASVGVVIADISDLDNSGNWTARNRTCDIAAQFASVHATQEATGLGQCEVVDDQSPQLSHGPDDNATGTRLYIGNQGVPADMGDASGFLDAGGSAEDVGDTTIRIVDLTTEPPRVLAQGNGPGHSIDWFRGGDGREYILHANEFVFVQNASCAPHPRPSSLGWAFEAFITEVTGDTLVRRSMLQLDINKSENCQAKFESGQGTSIAYHSVNDPYNATFAMVSFGDGVVPSLTGNPLGGAGLRLFDIRKPAEPKEVAYFNGGTLEHAGASHYDPERGLLYMPDSKGVRVLELQPQIVSYLGLKQPADPAYPRFPKGGPATPAE